MERLTRLSATDYKKITALILMVLIILGLMGKVFLILQSPINQDEFFYLSRVHDYMNTRLTDPFQNFHVYFFQWVNAVSTNEVSQIKACRMVMFLFFSGTCLFIYLIGKKFADTPGALFSVLCYLCFIFTMVNGAGFRSDTISTFLFLFSLYLFLVRGSSFFFQAISGLTMAVSVLITIKSAIYLIVFALLFAAKLIFTRQYKKTLSLGSVFLIAFLLGSVLFYKVHLLSISPPQAAVSVVPATASQIKTFSHTAGNAYSAFVSFENFFPRLGVFKLSLHLDWLIWLCLFMGVLINIYAFFKKPCSFENIALFVLLVPLLSVLFYRNAFPYYYLFITPTATIFCGFAIWKVTERTNNAFSMIFITIISGLIFYNSFIISHGVFAQNIVKSQEQTIDAIHQMFPEPVPYIDSCSMVASFPKAGFFMSSAGMRGYLKRENPVMLQLLEEKQPLFLLADAPHLNLNSETPPLSDTGLTLLQEDWNALRSNYIHHWGGIWVIGKLFKFSLNPEEQTFKILVPGLYSISSTKGVLINDHRVHHNDTIYLNKGCHTIKALGPDTSVTLKIGINLFKPEKKPIHEKLFSGSFM